MLHLKQERRRGAAGATPHSSRSRGSRRAAFRSCITMSRTLHTTEIWLTTLTDSGGMKDRTHGIVLQSDSGGEKRRSGRRPGPTGGEAPWVSPSGPGRACEVGPDRACPAPRLQALQTLHVSTGLDGSSVIGDATQAARLRRSRRLARPRDPPDPRSHSPGS